MCDNKESQNGKDLMGESEETHIEKNCESEKTQIQKEMAANGFLRERFLYLISSLCGANKHCKINMYENTQVTGTIKAMDNVFENIVIQNLQTPLPEPMKMAILRTCDIISFSYD